MINNFTKQLYFLLKSNKMLLLRPDDISKQMAPEIISIEVSDFMVFQAAIRKVDIGSILLKADMGTVDEKKTAVNIATTRLEDSNIAHVQAEAIVNVLVVALGWDHTKLEELEGNKNGNKLDEQKNSVHENIKTAVIPSVTSTMNKGKEFFNGLGSSLSKIEQKVSSEVPEIQEQIKSTLNAVAEKTQSIQKSSIAENEESMIPPTTPCIDKHSVDRTIIDKTKKKRTALLVAVIALILGIGGFVGNKLLGESDKLVAETEVTSSVGVDEKKVPTMQTDLSLGGLDIGLTVDEMHKRMGLEKSTKVEGNETFYYYDGLKIGTKNGKITFLVSNGSVASTKLGLHEGSSLDDVIQKYGINASKSDYNNLLLYEYTYESIDGIKGILRFAINKNDNKVNYISVRIPENNKRENKEIVLTYTGGKESNIQLSMQEVTLKIDQVLIIRPGDSSGDAGFIRLMTGGEMGYASPDNCVLLKSAGDIGYKGSCTEVIIQGYAPGEAVFTVVPNYGDWKHAVKLKIHVLPKDQ